MSNDRHQTFVTERMKRNPRYRQAFLRNRQQVDLAMLVREMREAANLSQAELAERAGTQQSVIARLEDAEYDGHSLKTIEKIAAACGVTLSMHAEKKPDFEREVVLV